MYTNYSREHVPWKNEQRWCDNHRLGIEAQVAALTNDELFSDYSELLAGDSWEGEFTTGGQLTMSILDRELRKRLAECGFLSTENNDNG